MNYLVQGWNIYRFLLSPDELRQILSPYHLVIFNAHVPVALYIRIDDDKKLHCSTACSYSFYSEDYMGIALEYPKMIQYRFGDDYEALKSTETLNSYQDFIRLRDSIKKITRPLSIKAAGVERRLNIRVSDVVRYQLNGCYSFRKNGGYRWKHTGKV